MKPLHEEVEEEEEVVLAEEVREDLVPEDRGVPDRDRLHLLTPGIMADSSKLLKRNYIVKNWQNLMLMEEKIGANFLIQNQKCQ